MQTKINFFSKTTLPVVLLILTSLVKIARTGMSLQEYTECVDRKEERKYSPITPLMCIIFPHLRSLKSCVLATRNSASLGTYSSKYFNRQLNKWKFGERLNVANPKVDNALRAAVIPRNGKQTQQGANLGNILLNRWLPRNPCATERSKRTTILYAVDTETGEILELFQDPKNSLYQTFFTRSCRERRVFGFQCVVQYVEFLTAVFKPNSFQVVTRPVKIPINCAMNIG